jgi:hypothetical protein
MAKTHEGPYTAVQSCGGKSAQAARVLPGINAASPVGPTDRAAPGRARALGLANGPVIPIASSAR